MAFDSSNRIEIPLDSPSSGSVTDFTKIVRLVPGSFESTQDAADFYNMWTSTDQTKARMTKSDGTTELAFDMYYLDLTSTTDFEIIVRFLWSGTMTSTGSYTAWLMPALSGNTSYGVSDTYGQYNAYDDDLALYAPDGSTTDRTSNQNTLTRNGSVANTTGPIGIGSSYGGTSADYASVTTDSALNPGSDLTLIAFVKFGSLSTTRQGLIVKANNTSDNYEYVFEKLDSDTLQLGLGHSSSEYWYGRGDTTFDTTTWHMYASTWSADEFPYISVDGGTKIQDATGGGIAQESIQAGSSDLEFGRVGYSTSRALNGAMCQVQQWDKDLGATFLAYEKAQVLDNASSIGTITVVSGGETIDADLLTTEIGILAPTFSAGATFTGDLQSIEVTSQQACFLSGAVITQGLQSVEIEILSPTFIAGTGEAILADLLDIAITTLQPTFNLGGDYIKPPLLSTEINLLEPTFKSGATISPSLLAVELNLLGPQFSEFGKVKGLLKVSISGKIPTMNIDGAVNSSAISGKIPALTITGEII